VRRTALIAVTPPDSDGFWILFGVIPPRGSGREVTTDAARNGKGKKKVRGVVMRNFSRIILNEEQKKR